MLRSRANRWLRRISLGFMICLLLVSASSMTAEAQTESQNMNQKYIMSYLYFGDPSQYTQAVDQTKGSMNMMSPSYFDLNTDGSLQLTDAVDTNFIAAMHERGIRVVPFLSNHWDRARGEKALANREQLAKQLAAAIEKYHLDGVNIDIENVTAAKRDDYTALVQRLRAIVPASKEISVAVAANPYGYTTGWHGSYDYKALAAASDYLIVMAYDESYEGSEQGPVASLPYVEKSIQYALKYVQPDKLVLGIPLYGRYWKSDGTLQGLGIQNSAANRLIQQFHGKVLYNAGAQAPKATVVIPKGSEPVQVHGKTLSPGTYTIWYENEKSITAKLALVQQYHLKGAGNWSLTEESANTWDYYKQAINHAYDFAGHWAEQAILYMMKYGWMTGVDSNHFQPNGVLTRAQAAAVIVRMKGYKAESSEHQVSFPDVPASHWAQAEIAIAKQHKLLTGRPDGGFGPNDPVTREELAMILYRLFNYAKQTSAAQPFTDVSSARWSSQAIETLAAHAIVHGYPNGAFQPTKSVTRAELATMIQAAEQAAE